LTIRRTVFVVANMNERLRTLFGILLNVCQITLFFVGDNVN